MEHRHTARGLRRFDKVRLYVKQKMCSGHRQDEKYSGEFNAEEHHREKHASLSGIIRMPVFIFCSACMALYSD
jgi:hypothetical protein